MYTSKNNFEYLKQLLKNCCVMDTTFWKNVSNKFNCSQNPLFFFANTKKMLQKMFTQKIEYLKRLLLFFFKFKLYLKLSQKMMLNF